MKNFFYSLVLVSIIVFGVLTTKNSFAESDSLSLSRKYPYKIVEIQPSGKTSDFSGQSSSFDLKKISADLGLSIYPEDRLSVFPDPKIGIGSIINLERAPLIKLYDGKKKFELRSWAQNVDDFFAEKHIELGSDDKVSPPLNTKISDQSSVFITRVAITNVVESELIDFKILEKEDPNLDYGKKRIESGIKGERKLTYRVKREDGDEVERTLISSEIVREAKNQIIFLGTKITVLSSVRGMATVGPSFCSIVSANYKKGTLIRITNLVNGARVIDKVDCTWGAASAPTGVVLDLSKKLLSALKWNGLGAGPNVLVEEIKQ